MENITLKKGNLLHAKLKNGEIIHGIIENVYNNSFMIDDDISGDILMLDNEEIEEIYHHFN